MNIGEWINAAHDNAVSHGWWDMEESKQQHIVMIVSEWIEALQAWRNEEGILYYKSDKPEGIAVELIDGVIRCMDMMGSEMFGGEVFEDEQEKSIAATVETYDAYVNKNAPSVLDCDFPKFIHMLISQTMHDMLYSAVCLALWYLNSRIGVDPERVLTAKHEYNKGRPYRHGNKRC